ncbi:alpha-amylase family glycosyl hydrolase [Olleya sp. YS]|uniref:alpha-amylase family glycosyl hydrolase n=1 Tax=Olleya sp. YS TaxID=3028318 RepID=UPI0024340F3D|nr:alpha-amylase family glycosyl hydrolase [Olleya sp. YS]WGD35487.1 alpha-amylase family glycosyl hydrolase [Olleya sp. YS]
MKRILFTLCLLLPLIGISQVTTNPDPILIDQPVTITVDVTATTCNSIVNPTKVYAHLGVGDDSNEYGIKVVGNWGQDDGVGEMTNNGDGTWSITFTPNTYFNLTAAEEANVTKMGMVFRNPDGTQELKLDNGGCQNFVFNVGAFQVTMINPESNGTVAVNNNSGTQILAQNTNGSATYVLKANGSVINTQTTTFYSYFFPNITENKYCELEVTQGGSVVTKKFIILVNDTQSAAMPANMENGINYTSNTTATLVLEAPLKDYVYVAGSFNNWTPTASHAMKKDPTSGKFWVEVTGLTAGQIETYQYWVGAQSPVADSPRFVKVADPFSTLVLSPFDDPWIPTSSYPNIPTYPTGQEREVTVLQTGQIPYNWQVTNFQKPKKEDLVIYEVLIRDFDKNSDGGRNFQHLIDRIDYFKNLKVNAIQLMPIMEFEGNESWGYNTSFHMALDKYYGTEDKFKEFVDLCHQNGIAVILDIALNHAFGRNPMVRMWMDDPDGDGWGEPSSENPYFNEVAQHSYSVGSDFNHTEQYDAPTPEATTTNPITNYYVERVIKHWIEEFKIDGFRWDLTKGFTQKAESGESATNSYQSDRVNILKAYADYSWSLDPTHYVIFEHLGGNQEEKEWADYRVGEDKGIMLWGKMTNPYNQLTMGYASGSDINGMGHNSRSFIEPRLIGYPESHDEERLMYRNLQFGNTTNPSHNVTDLNTSIKRMSPLGAVSLTIPGPKMIWHFGELGMENSIFTCNNGTVNEPGGADGDCKLDTKPQPQWDNNWLTDVNRSQVYNDWSRLNDLKINEPVFEGDYAINSGSLTPKIYIFDTTIPANELRNVVILANFDVTTQNITPDFPYTGTWYDLMDETNTTSINVTNTTSTISIPAGEFRIYGNAVPQSLSNEEFDTVESFKLHPNPASTSFSLTVKMKTIKIIDISGKLIKEFKGSFEAGHQFDIENLSEGLYLIKLENNFGQTKTTKLIKN